MKVGNIFSSIFHCKMILANLNPTNPVARTQNPGPKAPGAKAKVLRTRL